MTADEPELMRRLLLELSPHFNVTTEVFLRHPLHCYDLRIDAVAVPADELATRLPFTMVGVEVKADSTALRARAHAFKQCLDYRQMVVNDRRLPALRGLWLPCVTLYRGRTARDRLGLSPPGLNPLVDDGPDLLRLVGKFNVGVLEHGRGGLELRISDERIWSARYGVTDGKTTWPTTRLIANSRRRL